MQIVLHKEELYFLCMIAGAESVLGMEDVTAGLNEKELRSKWRRVAAKLEQKGSLTRTDHGEWYIDEKLAEAIAIISWPDQVYASLVENEDAMTLSFIHVKSGFCTQMQGEDTLFIQVNKDPKDVRTLLEQQFMLSEETAAAEVELVLPAELLSEVLTLAAAGARKSAAILLEPYDLGGETVGDLLDAYYENPDAKVIGGYHLAEHSGSLCEALFTCVRSSSGTWVTVMKPDRANMLLMRKAAETALTDIIDFYKM
ncbi:hypothetical protein DCC85_04090 [Paenibacillus sp. CAA11]|uniref:hypothetical protein n=1 Tax=Paenibacillus sp. CAA11 TaxID=1532905 RepID=UPI000D390965|nr:hypothetical protein [Paenibacillus sp. CAA11]AWB43482.1 hypothetical protein DCC85_04090 [Paenibacillus sp. CAA11]